LFVAEASASAEQIAFPVKVSANKRYFVDQGGDNNLAISMTLYHQRYRQHISTQNARRWATWLAARYEDSPNIVWSMTPAGWEDAVLILEAAGN
jgi:hypothetical protein